MFFCSVAISYRGEQQNYRIFNSHSSPAHHRWQHLLSLNVGSLHVVEGRTLTAVCAVVRGIHACLTHIAEQQLGIQHLFREHSNFHCLPLSCNSYRSVSQRNSRHNSAIVSDPQHLISHGELQSTLVRQLQSLQDVSADSCNSLVGVRCQFKVLHRLLVVGGVAHHQKESPAPCRSVLRVYSTLQQ